jgi:D-glycero-D-manno-heptose 1,7-bisphosphate phosphatase
MVIDVEHGTIDSPLHEDQVVLLPGAAAAVRALCDMGYLLAIVTNQPAAAKRKTTRRNLDAVHTRIVREVESAGGRIASSHICFHCAEDGCRCRKPRPGMLQDACALHGASPTASWMVGDGVFDVQAGIAIGARTAFLGPRHATGLLERQAAMPTKVCEDLASFVDALRKESSL